MHLRAPKKKRTLECAFDPAIIVYENLILFVLLLF